MNGACVGTWSVQGHDGDSLHYDPAWLQSEYGRPLSLSLPFTPGNRPHRGPAVRAYFDNLLPDSRDMRERLARRFRAGGSDAFTLLRELGRDCVGALQILPEADSPDAVQQVEARPLSEAEVAQLLRNTAALPSPGGRNPEAEDDFRISIAGAQEKTALLCLDGHWYRPYGATPTTHILKMPLGLVGNMKADMSESVENEWLCSEIVRAYGLPVARTRPLMFEDMKVLAVERFDRAWRTNPQGTRWLVRLPQEDMCQATGTPAHLKYEADGGPGMDAIMKLLSTSQDPDRDRRIFFQAQLLFWMLRAPDGHAKNFSLHLRQAGSYGLTPLYDVLSAYPVIGAGAHMLSPFKVRMAMAVRSRNAHWRMHDIQRRHWLALGARHGVVTPQGRDAACVIDDLLARTPQAVQQTRSVLPDSFPQALADSILDGLQAAADRLAA